MSPVHFISPPAVMNASQNSASQQTFSPPSAKRSSRMLSQTSSSNIYSQLVLQHAEMFYCQSFIGERDEYVQLFPHVIVFDKLNILYISVVMLAHHRDVSKISIFTVPDQNLKSTGSAIDPDGRAVVLMCRSDQCAQRTDFSFLCSCSLVSDYHP